jgi:hypothetical protein
MTQTKADAAVETAADKLETFVKEAQAAGGVKARGEAPTAETPGSPSAARSAPSGPQVERPRPKRPKAGRTGGLSPWLVIGAAFAVGYVAAKVIDWRGHAHPRD